MQHHLSMYPKAKEVRKKGRNFSAEKNTAITTEVDRLLAVGFIQEAHYLDWLSNVMLVKKQNDKWRMYVDFTDLNKAFSKDSFPLPRIDLIVDFAAGHCMLIMNAYSRYNQIWL